MKTLAKYQNKYSANRVAPKQGHSRCSFLSGFGFVFSDNIDKWMRSGNVTSTEYKKAKPLF
jgi:hypothetical protein